MQTLTPTYRQFITYFLIFQTILIAFGVPVYVRHCKMVGMSQEISFFSKKDNCCGTKKSKKHSNSNLKKPKTSCTKPLNPCCTFETSIWQADLEQSHNFEANAMPLWFLLFVLPSFLGFSRIFSLKNNVKKSFSRYFSFRPPPNIPLWLRVRCIIR